MDLKSVVALALPLFLNTSLQVVLNLTDTWFIGHLSTDDLSAAGACYYLVFVFFLIFGGVGIAVQTLVAQAFGAGHLKEAGRAAWSGMWGGLLTTPLFLWVAHAGGGLLTLFHLQPHVQQLAIAYWEPRLWGGSLSAVVYAFGSFFNGIARPGYTFLIMLTVVIGNALFNDLFIFHLHQGIAGAAQGSTVALGLGACTGLWLFMRSEFRDRFHTHLSWRPYWRGLKEVFALGIPTGLFPAMDVVGLALFQLMQVDLGPVDGAATQVVMMMTSISYMPAVGIALAGTTLVGQSIGAGDKEWAARCAQVIIRLAVAYMGVLGIVLAFLGPWVIPFFVPAGDPATGAVLALSGRLLWIAAGYQVFDALNISSAFCLRGAGDVRMPTLLLLLLSWGLFVPLCHALTFPEGKGWVHFLPQWGLGAEGGWWAALIYTIALGLGLWMRWRSGAWRRIYLEST